MFSILLKSPEGEEPLTDEQKSSWPYPPEDGAGVPVDDDTTDGAHKGYENFGQ